MEFKDYCDTEDLNGTLLGLGPDAGSLSRVSFSKKASTILFTRVATSALREPR
jgi:hypothetical protein